jgi:hypothetical protein
MYRISIVDTVIMQEYFTKKPKATKEDKERAKKLHDHLCKIVDGAVLMQSTPAPAPR